MQGARGLTPFDMGLFGGTNEPSVNGGTVGQGLYTPPPSGPKLVPSASQQNPMRMVLPCQESAFARRVGRPANAPDTHGMYPQTGYARGQRPGLASDPQKPVDGPLPVTSASNYFPFAPSRLGQPPG